LGWDLVCIRLLNDRLGICWGAGSRGLVWVGHAVFPADNVVKSITAGTGKAQGLPAGVYDDQWFWLRKLESYDAVVAGLSRGYWYPVSISRYHFCTFTYHMLYFEGGIKW